MQRERQKLKFPSSGSTSMERDFTEDDDRFCFSCEQIFPSKVFLEEHCCPAVSHICSCGTEFSLYLEMFAHSKTHEPGHSVLDHKSIKKRRFDKHMEQEEQLKRLLSAEQYPSTVPSLNSRSASSLEVRSKSEVPVQFAETSKRSCLPNSIPPSMDISKLFRASAPTIDLWTLYQPVVLMKKNCKFKNKLNYSCGKCLQMFPTKSRLVLHHNTHVKDKVAGCIGCGLLLSSNKSLPQYHQCNLPSRSLGTGVIMCRPVGGKKPRFARPTSVAKTLEPSYKGKGLTVTQSKMLRLNTFTRPHSNVSTHATIDVTDLCCRICRVQFESQKLLQRHKCIKAAQLVHHKASRDQLNTQWRNSTILNSPCPLPQVTRTKIQSIPPCGITNVYQHKSVGLNNGLGGQPISEKIELDSDDDCYIIESPMIKPNQMFCNVSSSLSIVKR